MTLDHLDGYRGSRPVRIGNAAVRHLQLDIYGELMDSFYLYDKYGAPLSYDMWPTVERLLDWVVKNWEQPDQSIWEVRGGRGRLHVLEVAVLGGARPRHPAGAKAVLSERGRRVAAGAQSHLQRHHAARAGTNRSRLSSQYFGSDCRGCQRR